jgi:thymidine kinase
MLNFKKTIMDNKVRVLLITAIMDFAGDEYETTDDLLALSFKSEADLVSELVSICRYFRDREN